MGTDGRRDVSRSQVRSGHRGSGASKTRHGGWEGNMGMSGASRTGHKKKKKKKKRNQQVHVERKGNVSIVSVL